MKWQEIREHYPKNWVLIEALTARTESNKRILEQLAVVGTYSDSIKAMKEYTEIHRQSPDRELYVFHTSRELLDITERKWHGIRGNA